MRRYGKILVVVGLVINVTNKFTDGAVGDQLAFIDSKLPVVLIPGTTVPINSAGWAVLVGLVMWKV